jgi:dTDP-4-dehydrorhamnose 3,5-epimerase
MRFVALPLAGAFSIEVAARTDQRGLFARTFDEAEFAAHALPVRYPQCSTSFNLKRGTLRGLHFQEAPHEEAKVVRCTRGAIYDVIVDLRPTSATRLQWFATELSADNRAALFVPRGFAHGFQTLADSSEVYYQIDTEYVVEASTGVRWNDPSIGIRWPLDVAAMSERDAALPLLP